MKIWTALLVVGGQVVAFAPSCGRLTIPRTFSPQPVFQKERDEIDIDEVAKQAQEALEAAQRSLGEIPSSPPDVPEKKEAVKADASPPTPPSPARDPPKPPAAPKTKVVPMARTPPPAPPAPPKKSLSVDAQQEAIAAAIGALVVGAGAGLALESAVDVSSLLDTNIPFAIPPAVGAVVTSGLIYGGSVQDNAIGTVTRTVFGKTTKGVGSAIAGAVKGAVTSVVEGIKAIPGKIADAAKSEAEKTTEKIKAIPGTLSDAASRKAKETAEGIQKIPETVAKAASQRAKEAADEIQRIPENVAKAASQKAKETAEDIQKIPSNVAKAAAQQAEKVKEDISSVPGKIAEGIEDAVEKVVDEVTAAPKKAVKDIEAKLSNVVPLPKSSEPPKVPTPPMEKPSGQQVKPSMGLSVPKIEPPSFEVPKISVPKIEPPKVSIPKIEIPKASTPKPSSDPKPTSTADTGSDFSFGEVGLKNFIDREIKQPVSSDADTRKADAEKKRQAQETLKARQQAAQRRQEEILARQQKQEEAKMERLRQQEEQRAIAEAKREEAARVKAQREVDAARQKAEREAAAQAAARAREQKREEAARQNAPVKRSPTLQLFAPNAQQSKPKPAPSKPRPSFQIGKSSPATPKPAASKPRPSFQIARPAVKPATKTPTATRAPRGVPTIVGWRKRRDGGVSGRIYGSPNFDDGDRIETTEIVKGDLSNGSVVQTGSGSRYFLSSTPPSSPSSKKGDDSTAVSSLLSAVPGATLTLSRARREVDAENAKRSIESAPSPRTFSLASFLGRGGDDDDTPVASPAPKKVTKKPTRTAPRGVPTLSRWRKNRDGSITGFISGSPSFSDGEKVTTSPIAQGNVESEEIVKTGSGSRYFLA